MGAADDARLSQMSTSWSVMFQAHGDGAEDAKAARRDLLGRYSRPVYRYLTAALRDPDAADEVYQEFALRLVRGDFRRARPDRGKFRDFLKTALYHLVVDHRRKAARAAGPLPPDGPAVEPEAAEPESDVAFLAEWRGRLLARAWDGLAAAERETGRPLHAVLRARTDHPDRSAAELAETLSAGLGRPVDAGWVRKWVHHAREAFAELLVAEVWATLDPPGPELLADELAELGLLDYCRGAAARVARHG